MCQLLLHYRADANTWDGRVQRHCTWLRHTGTSGVVQKLIDFGANLLAATTKGHLPYTSFTLRDVQRCTAVSPVPCGPNTRTARFIRHLHQASRSGHVRLWRSYPVGRIRRLLGTMDCSTPLCEASLHGHIKIVELLLESEQM